MDNPLPLGIAIGVLASAAFGFAICVVRAGSLGKAWWGLGIAGRATRDPGLESKIQALVASAAPPAAATPASPPPPPKPSGEPLRLLALLQAEARLLDFLLEDVSAASDQQLGAGVREVHRKAAAVLKQYTVMEPVLSGSEGDRVTVAAGFDPSAIRVIGNVTGQPPFSGELQHPGWRVKELRLPTPASGQDLFVLQPAEVQV